MLGLPHLLALFGSVGTAEILFVLLLVLLLFGASKIPELAKSLGKAQREFTKARQDLEDETPAGATEDDRVRRAAKDLGIPTDGKSVDELRAAIAEKVRS